MVRAIGLTIESLFKTDIINHPLSIGKEGGLVIGDKGVGLVATSVNFCSGWAGQGYSAQSSAISILNGTEVAECTIAAG